MKLPYLPGRTPSFAFIVHPRSEEDILRATCLSLLRKLSSSDADFVARVCALPPTIVGEVLFGFSPYRGEIVSIPCLPAEVATPRGRQEIVRAARMLVDRGAKVIGLGALIAPATLGGAWLVEQLPAGVTVTNGNAYTAAVLRNNVLDVVRELALNRPAHVAVLGSTGSVGGVLSRLLANSGLRLTLIGRGVARVRQTLEDLAAVARFSEELADVGMADVIVVLTSAASARLTPELIRDGAVVVDASEPANVSEEDARAWSPRIRVVRGGRVRIPDYHCTYDFGLEDATETFACLAETYLFSRDGMCEHSVGSPSPSLADRLECVALRHHIHPSFKPAQWSDSGSTALQASARRAL